PWLKESGNLVFRGGKVGIGTPNEVSNKLEVEQGPNEKSRFGTVTLGSGEGPYSSWAILTHKERIKYEQFAFAQAQTGRIAINCGNDGNIPRDEKIEFMFNNSTQGAWVNNNLVIGSASELSGADSSHKLQINGSAIKNDGKADWDTISDIRTKENIKDFKQGLNIIKKLDPISFSYNGFAGTPEGRQAIGVNAQELEKIFPSMVQRNALNKKHSHEDATELLTTNLSALKFIMVNAIKELDKRIESLENQSNNQSNNNIE
ncbi:MAG: tail fiber domain-containing protein, partial [Bacteroidales bacterium]